MRTRFRPTVPEALQGLGFKVLMGVGFGICCATAV